jgi:hypothetical protein
MLALMLDDLKELRQITENKIESLTGDEFYLDELHLEQTHLVEINKYIDILEQSRPLEDILCKINSGQ